MRIALAATLALVVTAAGAAARANSAVRDRLISRLIETTVSPDVAMPGSVDRDGFGRCLTARGVTASTIRGAIVEGKPTGRMMPCFDEFIGR